MIAHPENTWQVRQGSALRRWKDRRAQLRDYRMPIRNRIRSHHMVLRLVRGIEDNPGVFSHGMRVSDPLVVANDWSFRMRRWKPRKKK